MKVGLITFHNAINYGAALQAYASQQAIESLGVDCEIIDYVNEHRENAYNMIYHAKRELKNKRIISSAKYIAGGIFMHNRKKKFIKFYNENTKITSKRFRNSKEAKSLNDKFDKFVVGSDQVWNYKNNGQDFAFLLDFVEDNMKKISYASSFGIAEIPSNLQEQYKSNLKKIRKLSTRETYGVELIKNLTKQDAELVLDPVFLLKKEQWLNLCNTDKNTDKDKHIFVYTNRATQWDEFLSITGYPVKDKKINKISRYLSLKDFLNSKVKISYSISPIDFIDEIRRAELVVSASFHCIVMAIILNRPFVAILAGDRGRDERIINILKIAGLEDRILHKDMSVEDVYRKINYSDVEKILNRYITNSYEFLKESINS